ncbi:MAG: glycoside hydrolase family 57 protein [Gammaproteobacteria bacterium]|nr:glycoside hydrolase family 57 protein [Gammaproteobacteria bacterium]
MSDKTPLKVVIMWHMHQPHYRNAATGQYELPWTYLHAVKDYVDMAAMLEAVPAAKVVVNFAPVLLEQLDDYGQQIQQFLLHGTPISDPLLSLLVIRPLAVDQTSRLQLIEACLRANEERLIKRFAPFDQLATFARWLQKNPASLAYVEEQFFVDLLVWYHLAWMAETVRRQDSFIQMLQKKAQGFTREDCKQLLTLMGELIRQVIPRYRRLAERGQVELACSPYMHPIVPLLLEFNSAREAMPQAPLPEFPHYPGGEDRTRWHIEKGFQVFERYFGFRPRGCWPSEGSVSEETIKQYAEFGVQWLASGETVMRSSVAQSPTLQGRLEGSCLHSSFQFGQNPLRLFFRDDGLSDLIGFTYSSWHSDDAVNNLMHHLENIASACGDKKNAVVSIILDGENAWEYYPDNAYYFLHALYSKLSQNPKLKMSHFSDVVDSPAVPISLERLVAGSWVYGTFSTWIGDKEKNRGWDLLCEAKHAFDLQVTKHLLKGEALERATQQLAICEGSDWFWWFGDYNPSNSVRDFDRLYRTHLAALYQLIGLPVPEVLQQAISQGGGDPAAGGVMRQGKQN